MDRSLEKRLFTLIMISVFLIGIVLRLYGLGIQSFWYDELFSVVASSTDSLREMFRQWLRDDLNPPLYQLLLFGWFRLAPPTEFWARFPGALAGILSMFVLYFGSAGILKRIARVIGVTLLSLGYIGVYYSQEARTYSLLLFCAAAAMVLWLRVLHSTADDSINLSAVIPLVFIIMVLAYLHYFGVLLVIVLLLYWLLASALQRKPVRIPLFVGLIWSVAYLPWVPVILRHLRLGMGSWLEPAGLSLIDRFSRWILFKDGALSTGFLVLVLGIFGYIVVCRMRHNRLVRSLTGNLLHPGIALTWFVLLSLVVICCTAPFTGALAVRRLIILVPGYYLWFGWVVERMPNLSDRWKVLLVLAFGIAGLLLYLPDYYRPHKQQWREATRYAISQMDSQTVIASLGPRPQHPPAEYIRKGEINTAYYIRNHPFFRYYFQRFYHGDNVLHIVENHPESLRRNVLEFITRGKRTLILLAGHHLTLTNASYNYLSAMACTTFEKQFISTVVYQFVFENDEILWMDTTFESHSDSLPETEVQLH